MSMNTESLNLSYKYLEDSCSYYPRNKIIKELNMICDRINFSSDLQELFSSLKQGDPRCQETVTTLFRQEVSEEIFAFLDKLAREGLLWVLVGKDGTDFVGLVHNNLHQYEEVYFISAIKMSNSMREMISGNILMVREGEKVRIVFDENPSLIFGFVIQESAKMIDYSYKTNVIFYLKTYFKNKLKEAR